MTEPDPTPPALPEPDPNDPYKVADIYLGSLKGVGEYQGNGLWQTGSGSVKTEDMGTLEKLYRNQPAVPDVVPPVQHKNHMLQFVVNIYTCMICHNVAPSVANFDTIPCLADRLADANRFIDTVKNWANFRGQTELLSLLNPPSDSPSTSTVPEGTDPNMTQSIAEGASNG